jgi:acetyl-CoA acyltransferase 1
MLQTSENVSRRYGVGRKEQDEFAVESQRKAAEAQAAGRFAEEIVKISARRVEPETQSETFEVVDRDDGVRAGVSVEKLAKLQSVLEGGASTAGNSYVYSFELGVFANTPQLANIRRGVRNDSSQPSMG